mmetsp:Transcript_36271/g.96406  ORF Transcript_36271/g.96406 Transcript_36271/m.96406 type:complete len:341 (+) Transcript_36271:3103-4125(+)
MQLILESAHLTLKAIALLLDQALACCLLLGSLPRFLLGTMSHLFLCLASGVFLSPASGLFLSLASGLFLSIATGLFLSLELGLRLSRRSQLIFQTSFVLQLLALCVSLCGRCVLFVLLAVFIVSFLHEPHGRFPGNSWAAEESAHRPVPRGKLIPGALSHVEASLMRLDQDGACANELVHSRKPVHLVVALDAYRCLVQLHQFRRLQLLERRLLEKHGGLANGKAGTVRTAGQRQGLLQIRQHFVQLLVQVHDTTSRDDFCWQEQLHVMPTGLTRHPARISGSLHPQSLDDAARAQLIHHRLPVHDVRLVQWIRLQASHEVGPRLGDRGHQRIELAAELQ